MNRIALTACAPFLAACLAGCEQHKQTDTAEIGQPASASVLVGSASGVERYGQKAGGNCKAVPDALALQRLLAAATTQGEAGGFANGKNEWAAVVDREGRLCAVAVSTTDKAAAWPGSKALAKAKAFTANAFSSDSTPMSTARLYTMTLPGHSLWGGANANPFNPRCLLAPSQDEPIGEVCGGTIAFGGGLPLYSGQTRVGGLGLSGDTPCADHEVAKRVRQAAGLDPAGGGQVDDIVFASVDGPSVYAHPLCPNTWRNGKHVGDEPAPPADADSRPRGAPASAASES